jgi:hypothetical protein
MAQLDPILQKYYENRLSMMGEPAWKDLMEDVEAMLQSTNDVSSIQDEKTLHFRRGEISMMRWMLSLKETSENVYEDLKNETSS